MIPKVGEIERVQASSAPLAVEQVALGGAVIHVVREVQLQVERDEVETALGHQLGAGRGWGTGRWW